MRIYTRSGDQGMTRVLDGQLAKDDIRIEAIGTIDELNAWLGEAIGRSQESDLTSVLRSIQHHLFQLGQDLAQIQPTDVHSVHTSMITQLEQWIDQLDRECPEIQSFILPGGSPLATALHLCRVVCRRAERRVVTLSQESKMNLEICRYLNRLSDLLFVLARLANVRAGVQDIKWNP